MELIDRNKLKEYIDDCVCCEKCDKKGFMCNEYCELPDCVTPQWERVLNEQPAVDAIPIEFIQKRISYLQEIADYEFEASGGYTGEASTQLNELRRLIVSWSIQEKKNGIN